MIRKISIGRDYKDNAMHYAIGQNVYNGHQIDSIIEEKNEYLIYISKGNVVKLWKAFNKNMAISVEFDIDL
jgi:hypothetical protein